MRIHLELDINDLTPRDITVLQGIIKSAQAQVVTIPAPQQVPPAPQQVPPAPQQVPPAPQQVPPTPQQVPPAPQQVPPAPQQVPPAPEVAPEVESSNSGEILYDAAGVPWDDRIHSSGRSKMADNTWRRKRGVDEEYYKSVVKELLGLDKVVEADAPTAPATASPTGKAIPNNWAALLRLLTSKVSGANPEIQPASITAWLEARGVSGGTSMLATRADLYPEFCEDFKLC